MINLTTNDFNIAKSIIVLFPAGAGGKTVLNMLALSNDAVFQCAHTIKQQMLANNSDFKLNFLLSRLQEHMVFGTRWNDLGMGENYISDDYISPFNNKFYARHHEFKFHDVMRWVIDNQKTFFLTAHDYKELEVNFKIWPNSKIVYLANSHDFVFNKRSNHKNMLHQKWNDIKKSDWPAQPPTTLEEYNFLQPTIKKELETTFGNDIFNIISVFDSTTTLEAIKKITSNSNHYTFDCNCYNSVDSVISNIKFLYEKLNLSEFNELDIKKYFCAWKDLTTR